MLYIVNSFSLNMISGYKISEILIKKLDISEVRDMLMKEEFVSAIGHKATAEFLSKLLGIEIPANRIMVKLGISDKILVFQLGVRLEEGKVLSEDEIRNMPYEFYVIKLMLGTIYE